MLSGERKKFGMRTARAPMLVAGLSNTVIVYDDFALKYCFVSFSDALVEAVGLHLPRGCSPEEHAFLQVQFDKASGDWIVYAAYVSTWERVALWRTDTKPVWVQNLKTIRHNDNEHSNNIKARSPSRARSSTYATASTSDA